MVSQRDISQTREQITQQQSQLQQQKVDLGLVSEKRIPYTPRKTREAGRQIDIVKKQLTSQQEAYERDVARSTPQFALPKYLSEAYQEVKKAITTQVSNFNTAIQKTKDNIKTIEQRQRELGSQNISDESRQSRNQSYNDQIDQAYSQIDVLTQEKNKLQQGLTSDKVTTISKWFSGETQAVASAAAARKQSLYFAKAEAAVAQAEQAPKIERFQRWQDTYGKLIGINPAITQTYLKSVGDIYGTKAVQNVKRQLKQREEEIKVAAKELRQEISTKSALDREKLLGPSPESALGIGPMSKPPKTDQQSFLQRTEGDIANFLTGKVEDVKQFIKSKEDTPIAPLVAVPGSLRVKDLLFAGGAGIEVGKKGIKYLEDSFNRNKKIVIKKFKEITKDVPEISISTVALKVPVLKTENGGYQSISYDIYKDLKDKSNVEFIPYRVANPGKNKINLKRFIKETVGVASVGAQEKRIKLIQDRLNEGYGETIANRVQSIYAEDLISGRKNWDQALKEFEKTPEYKNILDRYKKDFESGMRISITPRALLAETSEQVVELVPETWLGYAGYSAAGLGISALSSAGIATGVIASKPISTMSNLLYESDAFGYAPTPKTRTGRFVKAAGASAAITTVAPTVGVSYGAEITKGFVTDPFTTSKSLIEFATQRPEEFLGFAVGGSIAKRGLRELEFRGRQLKGKVEGVERAIKANKVEPNKLKMKNGQPYPGEVYVVKTKKYGPVAYIETGPFAQSEAIAAMAQLNKLYKNKIRTFVQVSAQGIPIQKFVKRIGKGFEVKALTKPLRGYYEAPPMEFLKQNWNVVQTQTGALGYYAQLGARERLLPDPIAFIETILGTKKITKGRPSIQIRRTGTGIKVPKWISSTAESIAKKRKISTTSMKSINKYYNEFLKEKLTYNGKEYVGQAKLNLVNQISLKGQGTGLQLKYYAAVVQYQNKYGLSIPGGAEVLSGIQPYGPEAQLVTGLGARFFEKSLKDLRKARQQSVTGRMVDFLTGTKRGEAVVKIRGQLVELQPVRLFSKKPSKAPADLLSSQLTSFTGTTSTGPASFLTRALRRRRPPKPTKAPRPFMMFEDFAPEVLVPRRDFSKKKSKKEEDEEERKRKGFFDDFFVIEPRRPKSRAVPKRATRREPRRPEFRLLPEPTRDRARDRPRPGRPRDRTRPDEPRRPTRGPPRRPPREPPRPPREPPRPPRRPPRTPDPERFLMMQEPEKKRKPKQKEKKKKKKPTGRRVKPTAFQLVEGVQLISRPDRPIQEFTGFEVFR